jgi:hypothetical protein
MRHTDIDAFITQLRVMFPGDMEPEAALIWDDKLSAFDDDDQFVRVALDTCLEMCEFRPSWSEFSTAYKAAKAAAHDPVRRQHVALPAVARSAENPATRIKAMLAAARTGPVVWNHPPGTAVTVQRHSTPRDPLSGKTGTYLGRTPDGEWLRVDIADQTRIFKPSQLVAR